MFSIEFQINYFYRNLLLEFCFLTYPSIKQMESDKRPFLKSKRRNILMKLNQLSHRVMLLLLALVTSLLYSMAWQVRTCLTMLFLRLKQFSQNGHCCFGSFPHSRRKCLIMFFLNEYIWPQLGQWQGPWWGCKAKKVKIWILMSRVVWKCRILHF